MRRPSRLTEIRAGRYRGPLHGIPYGIKDLFATSGAPTSWGAKAYATRVLDYDATVVTRLREAGAVLVAKLSTGELSVGDLWFGGRTRNPWNPGRGSEGSSAGSASATSAGLVAFAVGAESGGSIINPASTCGVVGLRPTFGRVSRYGCMPTMDARQGRPASAHGRRHRTGPWRATGPRHPRRHRCRRTVFVERRQ